MACIQCNTCGKQTDSSGATIHCHACFKRLSDFYDAVACLIAEGSEFMTKSELYDAIKREYGNVKEIL